MAKRQLLALVLVFIMLFSIAGCKKTNTENPSNTPEETAKPSESVYILSTVTPVPDRMPPVVADK